MDCFGSSRRCSLRHGSIYKIHFQHLNLGDTKQVHIEVPLSVSKKVMGTSLERKRGWVTWYSWDSKLLCSTSLSQWDAESRTEWLQDVAKKQPEGTDLAQNQSLSPSSSSSRSNILLFFVLLHGMSPPGADFDVIENWSNIIHAVFEAFSASAETGITSRMGGTEREPKNCETLLRKIFARVEDEEDGGTLRQDPVCGEHPGVTDPSKPRLQACFWAPTYRKQTWMSIEACLEVIVPALARELEEYVEVFDSIHMCLMGHSLGGLLSRFIFNRRLPNLLAARKQKDSGQSEACHETFSRLAAVIANERIHLETLCTLASPHAGSLGTKSIMRILPETMSKLRFFNASQMAQQVCNLDEAELLWRLCLYEAAGESWIWSERLENSNLKSTSSGIEKSPEGSSPEKRSTFCEKPYGREEANQFGERRQFSSSQDRVSAQHSGERLKSSEKSFKQVILYGVLNTDWLVGANSALGTQLDVSKTRAAENALLEEMTPVCLDLVAERGSCIIPDLLAEETDPATRKAGDELEILEKLPNVKRYLVHIPQNPIMTRPHSTLKGAPSLVTPEREKSMRLVASRILRHVAMSLLS